MNRTLNISRSYESGLASNTWNPTSYNNAYLNAFEYDAMGNILTQQRHKRDGTKIEEMSYQYQYANALHPIWMQQISMTWVLLIQR
jgi:hypothetical protein